MKLQGNRVVSERGDVLAEKVYGQWQSKEQAVLDFIKQQESAPKKVRARDEDGHFVADDPKTTDVNEAWVDKLVKKARKKK